MQLPFLVLGWTVVTQLDTVGGFVGSGKFWSLGFVGLHLLFLACRLARKRIYEAWRRRVGWTVLEQFHPMSPNVIHSYPILTLFGDSWWFLMLMPSFFVLVVCKPQAYPESSFRTWCSYPSLWFVGSVEFWSLGFVGLHLLSWLAGLPGSASTERGEGELGELCWDNVHVFFWIECWLVERFRGFQNLFTRAPVDFGWWGSRSLDWF